MATRLLAFLAEESGFDSCTAIDWNGEYADLPIALDGNEDNGGFVCSGDESSFEDCYVKDWFNHDCTHE
jgi:hypothetical protein